MRTYNLSLSDADIKVLLQMITFGQLEISRQMKRLSTFDYDLKEYYWYYRRNSNELKDLFFKLRGF